MNVKHLVLLAVFCLSLVSCSEKIDYEFTEKYIIQSAADWAEAIAVGDTTTISRIMANDFVGVSSRGEIYDKKTMLEQSLDSPNRFKTEVFDVTVRFYEKAAVAQGYETWTKLSDSTSTKSIWTDTWIFRNGKWQIVAAQDHRYQK
jgi:hypothetical protein